MFHAHDIIRWLSNNDERVLLILRLTCEEWKGITLSTIWWVNIFNHDDATFLNYRLARIMFSIRRPFFLHNRNILNHVCIRVFWWLTNIIICLSIFLYLLLSGTLFLNTALLLFNHSWPNTLFQVIKCFYIFLVHTDLFVAYKLLILVVFDRRTWVLSIEASWCISLFFICIWYLSLCFHVSFYLFLQTNSLIFFTHVSGCFSELDFFAAVFVEVEDFQSITSLLQLIFEHILV